MNFQFFSSVCLALILAACSPVDSGSSTGQVGATSKNAKPKICVKNGTTQTFYFGVSNKGFGTMTSQLEPNAKFCTAVKGDPKIFIRQEKKTQNLCESNGRVGLLYTLVDTIKCTWQQEPA